jgi:putative two-component system response regulator
MLLPAPHPRNRQYRKPQRGPGGGVISAPTLRIVKKLQDDSGEAATLKAGVKMIFGKMVKTLSNLLEFRGGIDPDHVERIECFLRVLIEEMFNRNVYVDTLRFWNMESFFQSAVLHDIGKIAVRESILLKPGKLSAEEFDEIKKHTIYGEDIINKMRLVFPESKVLAQAQIIAGTHHEKWDGTGYPRGLAGEDIPLEGRFMALADVFESLISERSYKKPCSFVEALQIIKEEAGSYFDPRISDAFITASRHLRAFNDICPPAYENEVVRDPYPVGAKVL